MPDRLQPGVYFRHGQRPPAHWALLVLAAPSDAPSREVGAAISRLWTMWSRLREGDLADLPGARVPHGSLDYLVAYGPHVFALPGAPQRVPDEISPSVRFRSPLATGGGPLLAGAGLSYSVDVNKNTATEAVAVQFTADTPLAVSRAIVESWKLLHDNPGLPLSPAGVFTGFQRDDGRSWIDFHDGISNIPGEENRRLAVEIPSGPQAGGTTMCFIRLGVDLARWRKLNRTQQELIVGRDKLSGCPLIASSGGGTPASGCPVAGTGDILGPGNEAFREAPLATERTLQVSHVHRANRQRSTDFGGPSSLRIFRQGYEYFEPARTAPGFQAGLNFVSFQAQLSRVVRMLAQPEWLGRTNFGGVENGDPAALSLLDVRAAAMFLVPPRRDEEPFPGSSYFG